MKRGLTRLLLWGGGSGMLALLLALSAAEPAQATGGIFNTFTNLYPSSMTGTNAGCATCHAQPSGGANWNAYGWQIKVFKDQGFGTSQSILMSEPFDSDADPTATDNIGEISADTQPGWTDGPNNRIYFADGSFEDGHSAPPSVIGDLDPPAPCIGDADGNNVVDSNDIVAVFKAWGATGGPEDVTGDGIVDVMDLLLVLAVWGTTC